MTDTIMTFSFFVGPCIKLGVAPLENLLEN